ncbi:MAG: deoxyribodipyrimidine photo-lyase [Phycisphaerales bacterium JB050]
MRPLVWFRSDLRTRDNTALHRASKSADNGVVALLTVTPKQWKDKFGWGDPKADFVLRNMRDLTDSLASLNIPVRIITQPTFAGLDTAIIKLMRECKCDALFFNREYEHHEVVRDEAVATAASDAGFGVHEFTDQTIYPPASIRTGADKPYSVYTPFKKSFCARWKDGDQPGVLDRPRKQSELDIPSDDLPESLRGFNDPNLADRWPSGEKHAASRLKAFIDRRLADYADHRDIPSLDGTSSLSPYLAAGVLSPRQCFHAALAANQNKIDSGKKGVVVWIQELIWREFYKSVLVGFPRVSRSRAFKQETERIKWNDDDQAFEAWCEGRTGYPIVDAAMRQLNATGWMHNRLRMITAAFLTKDLLVDWRRGEAYFASRLIDLDLASNNGGWQWSASTGTDAQPYFRIFNPTSQSERFDPDGTFIRKWVPELDGLSAKQIHAPSEKAGSDLFSDLDYPDPIVDHAKARDQAIKVFKDLK